MAGLDSVIHAFAAAPKNVVDGRVEPTAARFAESGCSTEKTDLPKVVVTGLDPVIHALSAPMEAAWMAGSSPAMTALDWVVPVADALELHRNLNRTAVDQVRP